MNNILFTILVITFVIGCSAYTINDTCDEECMDVKLLELVKTLPGGKTQAFEILNSHLRISHNNDGPHWIISSLIEVSYTIIMTMAIFFLFLGLLMS